MWYVILNKWREFQFCSPCFKMDRVEYRVQAYVHLFSGTVLSVIFENVFYGRSSLW